MLETIAEEFGPDQTNGLHWTNPAGGLYVWMTFPEAVSAGPESRLMRAALSEEVLYVPGQFCYVEGGKSLIRNNEARLSFGVAAPEQLREGIQRLARAYRAVCDEKLAEPVASL
jgi:DNA-binding transcriptional MocR family regulator